MEIYKYAVNRINPNSLELTEVYRDYDLASDKYYYNDVTRSYVYKARHWIAGDGWQKAGWYNYDGNKQRRWSEEDIKGLE